ncbi:NAD-dependent deacetylase [Xanthomonas bromi]|uniref:protein acetyllysine N-acetyltransferase n=1 Tax=Xanthomonas bromi TaxID=56449 RepID=A0A1C3NQB7_9XANT|nr:NAD-dependent deacetylase [Xanthomonas bromi]
MSDSMLSDFVQRHRRLFVLTGAGCSTDSGIPDYRDRQGGWKRPQPVTFQAFMGELSTRQRYWARSLVGWPRFGLAQPNATHHALAALEARGQLEVLLTQNVDRLHQAAGSQAVIDLHGRLDVVRCMGCERRMPRTEFQRLLERDNPGWAGLGWAGLRWTRRRRPMAMRIWTMSPSRPSWCRRARCVAAYSSRMWCSSARTCRASGWSARLRICRPPMRCWWWARR